MRDFPVRDSFDNFREAWSSRFMKVGLFLLIGVAGLFMASCKTKESGPNSESADGGTSEVLSEQEMILAEWDEKLSKPDLGKRERQKELEAFGADERVPVYDLVAHVTKNYPEKDWFRVFFHRINKEEKVNVLECLRAYPLLDKGRFAKDHCDRSFGLNAGKQAPLEGLAWCEKIQDPQRQKSAAYGLVVSLPKYAEHADPEDVKEVLKVALKSRFFPIYHQDSIARSSFGKLHQRGLLKADMKDALEGLLSEKALKTLAKYTAPEADE